MGEEECLLSWLNQMVELVLAPKTKLTSEAQDEDKIPFGAFVNKGLTMKTGQTHVQAYTKLLLEKIEEGKIDPSFVVTHTVPLEETPDAYKTFRDKKDGCIKVVLKP